MTDKEKEYWNSRINNIYDKNYEAKKIELLYKKAYYEVEEEIKKLYEELKDKGELTTTKLYQYDRFMSLRRQIKSQCKDIRSSLTSEVRKKLSQSYKETFQTVNKMLGQDNTWGIQNQKMAQKVINTKWEGSNFSKRIWKNTDSLAKDIESNIVSCVINGTNKDTIVKIIKNRYNVGFNKADRLVRTELMHTINSAQIDTYKEDGVEYVEWYAAEDERMCSICGEMHEKKFKTTEAPSIAHANCRCILLPVVDKILTKGLGSKDTSKSETEEHKLPKNLKKLKI